MSVNNLEKVISYIVPVAKERIMVDDIDYSKPVKSISLGSKLFHSDGCVGCGSCDVVESTVLTQSEYDKVMSMTDEEFRAVGFMWGPEGFDTAPFHRLKEGLYEEKHIVNGTSVSLWIFDLEPTIIYQPQRSIKGDKMIERCTWAVVHNHKESNQYVTCGIWPVRSITCHMPHLRFYHNPSGTVSISENQYGRNHILRCPIIFQPPKNEEQFNINKENRLDKLIKLKNCADDFHISTYLPEIIDYVKKVPFDDYTEYLEKPIVSSFHKRKLFDLK